MGKTASPKTHSEILWHFTGGPKWDSKKNRQMRSVKSAVEAFEIARSILSSKTLRLGSYHEVIKVKLPVHRVYDKMKKKLKIFKNHVVELKTAPVCCVADIPKTELFHHAKKYGKMGIGFKRTSLVKNGFNPAFYTLDHTDIAKNFYSAQNTLDNIDLYDLDGEIDSLIGRIESELCERCQEDVDLDASDIASQADTSLFDVENTLASLQHLMSFVKTFDPSEFDSIYAEREWRSLNPLNFKMSDIEAIIFPSEKFRTDFQNKHRRKLGVPKKVELLLFDKLAE